MNSAYFRLNQLVFKKHIFDLIFVQRHFEKLEKTV